MLAGSSDADIAAPTDGFTVLNDPAAEPGLFCRAWLALQASSVQGATHASLVLLGRANKPEVAARWTVVSSSADLMPVAGQALATGRTVISWGRGHPGRDGIATVTLTVAQPLGPDGRSYGVVAITVIPPGGIAAADPEGLARQLRAASGWLELLGQRERAKTAAAASAALNRTATALDVVAAAGEHDGLARSCMALVNNLALRLDCARASVGLVRGRVIRVQAISHVAIVQRSNPAIEAIEDAMMEALLLGATVAWPATADARVGIDVAHQLLAKDGATLSVSIPAGEAGPCGVLTLERPAPFDDDALAIVRSVAILAGPVLRQQMRARRWVAGRVLDATAHGLRVLFGPRRPAVKLAAVAGVLLVMGAGLAQGTHRVTAKAVLEGEEQRAAVAPFDGFVLRAPVRAGDTVGAGTLLAALDDRDLVLERVKAWAEREKLRQRLQEALAKHERAGTAVLIAQVEQAQASLSLAEDRLERSRIVSSLEGVVVSGDLSQMLGTPVERGKVLFEVAPLNRFRLAMEVDETAVRWVDAGQEGAVRFASQPGWPVRFRVTARMPVAAAEDGRNTFRVEAVLLDPANGLRPGMEGVAKIEAGSQNLAWVWTHPMIEAVQLFLWKWLP